MPETRDTTPRTLGSCERMLMPFGAMENHLRMVRLNGGKPLPYTRRPVESILGADALRINWGSGELVEENLLVKAGSVGVISIDAPVFFTASLWAAFFGCVTVSEITRALHEAACDDTIERVAIDFNCPGGQCAGISDLVAAIDALAAVKPVVSLVHDQCASLAAWMASRTHRIVSTPSGEIGSIGAIAVAYDDSAMYSEYGVRAVPITEAEQKTFGRGGVAISDEMVEREMAVIRQIGGQFRASVSAKTGIDERALLDMQGAMHHASTAMDLGLVDEVRPTAEFYAALAGGAYDGYASRQATNTSSGERAASTQEEDDMSDAKKKAKKTLAEMSAEEKEAMRLALEEEEATTENEDEEASEEEEDETAEGDEDEDEEASEEEEEDNDASTGARRRAGGSQSARMTIGKAESILAPHKDKLPEATRNKLVLDAVRTNQSSEALLSTTVSAVLNAGNAMEIEQAAKGSDGFIGGGSSGAGAQAGGGGSAQARIDAEAAKLAEKNPSMSLAQAKAKVLSTNTQLREALIAEANAARAG